MSDHAFMTDPKHSLVFPDRSDRHSGLVGLTAVLVVAVWLVAGLPLPEAFASVAAWEIGPLTFGSLYGVLGIGFVVVVLALVLEDEWKVRRGYAAEDRS